MIELFVSRLRFNPGHKLMVEKDLVVVKFEIVRALFDHTCSILSNQLVVVVVVLLESGGRRN